MTTLTLAMTTVITVITVDGMRMHLNQTLTNSNPNTNPYLPLRTYPHRHLLS